MEITFKWVREKLSDNSVVYIVTVSDEHNENFYQVRVEKGYDSIYKRQTYRYTSTRRNTLKEIKEYTEENIIQRILKGEL